MRLLLIFILFLVSCVKDPKSTEHEGEFAIQLLFEHDGCKVYRFSDGGRFIYYSSCNGRTQYTASKSNIIGVSTAIVDSTGQLTQP